MTGRRRLLLVAVGAGVLLAALPASAQVDGGRQAGADELAAVRLLEQAAAAGRHLSWTGTQYVATWRSGTADAVLVDLEHDPVHGSVVREPAGSSAEVVAATAVLDPRMLRRLAATYALTVTGPGRCAGRTASIVEARRADGGIAGRFWVDRDSGMLLRREVFDRAGSRVRSSAFVDLSVTPAGAVPAAAPLSASVVEPAAVEQLRDDGWDVPESLPQGFRLFETRLEEQVLHLAYTDGLSTLSVFAQRGELGAQPLEGFERETVADRPVLVRRSAPERVVWSGSGRVFTLVSDAPEDAVLAAVGALPHDADDGNGLLARLGRGGARLAGMLNPFG